MIAKPWELDKKSLGRISKLPPARRQDGLLSYQHFNHNSYKVPCYSSFVIYGLFLLLIVVAGVNRLYAWSLPSSHAQCRRKLRLIRAHIFEHPLVCRKHSEVASFPGLGWLTLQLPLRGEAIVLLLLSLANFLPLVAFYDLLTGDRNTIYPGPTGKRDQICRHLADRTAILGTAQLPLLIIMASKRTPLAIVAGLGMNRLMLFHRWIARWVWLHIVLHTAAFTAIYIRRGGSAGVANLLEKTYVKWGVVSLSMMFGLVFLSLRVLRQWSYEIFVLLHILMAFFAVLGAYLHIALIHSSRFQMFVVMTEISAAVWAFDRAVRLVSRMLLSFSSSRRSGAGKLPIIKCATAAVSSFDSNSKYTLLRISLPAAKLRFPDQPRIAGGIAAGDDIRITIPRLQWIGEHPFTVFSVGSQPDAASQGYVELLIKTEAGITRKLSELIKDHTGKSVTDKDMEAAGKEEEGRDVAVLVEGPFGMIPDISEASNVVLVSGGIAITYCWPLFLAAVQASEKQKLKSCKLVWMVRDEELLTFISKMSKELVEEMEGQQGWRGCSFSIDLYVTSSASTVTLRSGLEEQNAATRLSPSMSLASLEDKESACSSEATSQKGSTPSSENIKNISSEHDAEKSGDVEGHATNQTSRDVIKINKMRGRPAVLSAALFGHLNEDELRTSGGLTVGLCGPAGLCDDVRVETVKMLKAGYHIELLEDCFTW